MTPIDPQIFGLELKVYAKEQPEYVPLPARVDEYGTVITRWKLTWRERWKVFWSGELYITVMTFNKPLQPIRCSIERPEIEITEVSP
jgi:hypothetical protein